VRTSAIKVTAEARFLLKHCVQGPVLTTTRIEMTFASQATGCSSCRAERFPAREVRDFFSHELRSVEWSPPHGFFGVSGSGASTLICDTWLLNVITGLGILTRRIVGGLL